MMAVLASESSNPKKLLLIAMPGGGTRPSRDPGGYITSAACTACAASRYPSNGRNGRRNGTAKGIDGDSQLWQDKVGDHCSATLRPIDARFLVSIRSGYVHDL